MPTRHDDAPAPNVTPSQLSSKATTATLSSLAVQLNTEEVSEKARAQLENIQLSWRASCFLAAAQIFLQSNAGMKESLTHDDIKARLLGHWGTSAPLCLSYSHMQALLARNEDTKGLFVTGPGHGGKFC